MEIHVDYNPTPKDHFFISTHLSKAEAISFDHTIKGHRIIKQVFVEKIPKPKKDLNSQWNTYIIKNGRFLRKYSVKWIDMKNKDWLNGEIWETKWEKPLSRELSEKILKYSQFISDNCEHLNEFPDKLKEFDKFIEKEVSKHI